MAAHNDRVSADGLTSKRPRSSWRMLLSLTLELLGYRLHKRTLLKGSWHLVVKVINMVTN